jgi:hypothetical protein
MVHMAAAPWILYHTERRHDPKKVDRAVHAVAIDEWGYDTRRAANSAYSLPRLRGSYFIAGLVPAVHTAAPGFAPARGARRRSRQQPP